MFSVRLLSSTTLIYIYLILVYSIAMNGVQGVSDAAVNTVLVSCAGATGMACFAFGFRHLQERVQYRVPLYIVGLCAVSHLLMEIFSAASPLFFVEIVLATMGWGFLTAFILCRVATEVSATHFGRFIGLSYGGAALLQFAVGEADRYFTEVSLAQWGAIACLAAFTYFIKREPISLSVSTPQSDSPVWSSFFQKSRVYLLGGAAVLSLLMGLSDSVTIMHYAEYAPSFPASRLFYAMGLVAFGWLADRRMLLLPGVVLLTNAYYLWFRAMAADADLFILLAQIVEAVYSAPAIILLTVGFLHAAAHSACPERWAAMGRIVGLPLTSFGLMMGLWLWPLTSTLTMLAVYTTLLLVAIALLYRSMLGCLEALVELAKEKIRAASHKPETETQPVEEKSVGKCEDESGGDIFTAYCRRYSITAKEAEILLDILKGQNADEIAAAQFITKRTVRFHISNLLHKTGNKTQIAMIAHFHKVTEDTALLEMDKHTSESSAI